MRTFPNFLKFIQRPQAQFSRETTIVWKSHFFQKRALEDQNLPGKLGQQSAICWNSLGLFKDYSLNNIFFWNKTFLFFKIESWKKYDLGRSL